MKKFVAEDWRLSLIAKNDGGSAEVDNIDSINFSFQFTKKELLLDIKLPLEYETNIATFMEKIDAQPVSSFDDLEPFDPIEQLEFEIEKYKALPAPTISNYDPLFKDKLFRPGCEYESALR